MSYFSRFRSRLLAVYGRIVVGARVDVYGLFTVANRRNLRVGKRCAINHGVFILARNQVVIGDDVVLSARCMLIDGGLDPDTFGGTELPQYANGEGIVIEDGAWIGAGAIILPGVTIGRRAVVGAGSVVTRSVEPLQVVVGNPAKPIRKAGASR